MESVLIANRGEIAVRVIRAAQELDLRTIAIYSELDRDALHVELADEAWNVGAAPAAESYLNIDRILEVAGEADADAVHPGYGFLAENADFAAAVTAAGLTWIGPPPDAIATMGDKISSRKAAEKGGVRSVPGTFDPVADIDEMRAAALDFGYPVAVKAAHGGGGKGLKIVNSPEDLDDAYEAARREADAYFGDPEVYLEKYLEHPRHIEAQVLYDHAGNGVFLGERDCSMQRRHQKLIEETPATRFTEDLRRSLGDAALAVADAAGYQNAGTVEFLVDREGELYFLEMNTRLQVEHTITEMVTGIDLAREQFRLADGGSLPVTETPAATGHAIEFRINAEDPGRNFLPTPGRVVDYHEPSGFGVRVDGWVRVGTAVSQYYDNLLAKLVVWGSDREEAISRSRRALSEFRVTGLATTIPLHLLVLEEQGFIEGDYHTRFVEEEMDLSVITRPTAPALPEEEELTERSMTVEVGGRRYVVRLWAPEQVMPTVGKAAPRRRPPRLERPTGEGAGMVVAPMQGTIVKVSKKAGERIKAKEPLCVLEAMKMENEIRAPIDGEIVDLRVQPGDTVATGAVLAIIR